MKFNDHSSLKGQHAFLSPSKYHWINYDPEKLVRTYLNSLAVERGNQLHDLASRMIFFGVRAAKSKETFNMYVNDAIGFRMTVEQPLVYSDICFGTADAISFNEKKQFLRIHDLKTGETPAHMEQLLIYAALFCLEYRDFIDFSKLQVELRIYQSNDILLSNPEVTEIQTIMDIIVRSDKELQKLRRNSVYD